VNAVFIRFTRSAIVPMWLIVFGLAALMWSPLTVAMGVCLLLAALAGSVGILMWQGR
jgi:hypothetical protein